MQPATANDNIEYPVSVVNADTVSAVQEIVANPEINAALAAGGLQIDQAAVDKLAAMIPPDPTTMNYREELRTRMVPFRDSSKGPIRFQRLPICKHKFVHGSEPRHRNCESCWFAFFQIHGEITQLADEIHSKHGLPGLRQLKGPKFAKNFTKFMATLAVWKKATEEAKQNANTEESAGGTSGSGGNAAEPGPGAGEIVPGHTEAAE